MFWGFALCFVCIRFFSFFFFFLFSFYPFFGFCLWPGTLWTRCWRSSDLVRRRARTGRCSRGCRRGRMCASAAGPRPTRRSSACLPMLCSFFFLVSFSSFFQPSFFVFQPILNISDKVFAAFSLSRNSFYLLLLYFFHHFILFVYLPR